jgi:hypothetical protein
MATKYSSAKHLMAITSLIKVLMKSSSPDIARINALKAEAEGIINK